MLNNPKALELYWLQRSFQKKKKKKHSKEYVKETFGNKTTIYIFIPKMKLDGSQSAIAIEIVFFLQSIGKESRQYIARNSL